MATISVQTKKFADLEAILSVTGTEQMAFAPISILRLNSHLSVSE